MSEVGVGIRPIRGSDRVCCLHIAEAYTVACHHPNHVPNTYGIHRINHQCGNQPWNTTTHDSFFCFIETQASCDKRSPMRARLDVYTTNATTSWKVEGSILNISRIDRRQGRGDYSPPWLITHPRGGCLGKSGNSLLGPRITWIEVHGFTDVIAVYLPTWASDN